MSSNDRWFFWQQIKRAAIPKLRMFMTDAQIVQLFLNLEQELQI